MILGIWSVIIIYNKSFQILLKTLCEKVRKKTHLLPENGFGYAAIYISELVRVTVVAGTATVHGMYDLPS